MLPNDIHMLVSMINMKLRDDDMSLSHVLDINDLSEEDFLQRLADNNYYYDDKTNQTRFILIGDFETEETGHDKTSIAFSTENKPGALLNILQIFMQNNINLSYIASRPAKQQFGDYIFIVSFEGHVHNPGIIGTIKQIKQHSTFMRFFGSYRKSKAIVLQH